jgi:hypothetical protein
MTCFAAMVIAGGTLAIDGLSGDAMSEAGGKGRQVADIHSGCTVGQGRASDNVVDFSRINVCAGGGVTQGMDVFERAAMGLADGCARGRNENSSLHTVSLPRCTAANYAFFFRTRQEGCR